MSRLRRFVSTCAWLAFVGLRRIRVFIGAIKRRFVTPALPTNPSGEVLIHLGCGEVDAPGYINVDGRHMQHVHYVREVTDLSVFPDDFADLVYACHVLEHIPSHALRKTLWEWRRVVKPGGILRLSVPDFDRIVRVYEACHHDIDAIQKPLMGGQGHHLNVHYSVFNEDYLTKQLMEDGFREVKHWNAENVAHHDFDDWANSELIIGGRRFPISLNLEAVK